MAIILLVILFGLLTISITADKQVNFMLENNQKSSSVCNMSDSEDISEQVCLANNTCYSNRHCVTYTNLSCPVWFYCVLGKCECYPDYNDIVLCNQQHQYASVVDCFCVSVHPDNGEIVVGNCLEMCVHPYKRNLVDNVYHRIPKSPLHFNEEVCGVSNRTGVLCGSCNNGTYPLVYSYNHTCVSSEKCGSSLLEVLKYIFAVYGPLTVFYIIIVVFQINTTSTYLHGLVILSQVLTVTMQVRAILSSISSRPALTLIAKIITSIFSIWNLDFFRSFYNESICFSLDSMAVMSLNYLVASYPLFLSILSYYLIELYDQDIKIIVLLWKPMKCIRSLFRNNWKSHTTVIDAYATFFILSYTKVLETSFNLLAPTTLYHVNPNRTTLVLYSDGTVKYFSSRHVPYAVLAIFFFVTVNVLPVLVLMLYQCSFFQVILSKLPLRLDILHTFMDILQGCYKNGTTPGMRDLRWFSSTFFIFRIIQLLLFSLTLNSMFYLYSTTLSLIFFVLILFIRPFKEEFPQFGHATTIFTLFLALTYACILSIDIAAVVEVGGIIFVFYLVASFTIIIPIVYMFANIMYWVVTHCKLFSNRKDSNTTI